MKFLIFFPFLVLLSFLAQAQGQENTQKRYNKFPGELSYQALTNDRYLNADYFFNYWVSSGRHQQKSETEQANIQIFERWLNLDFEQHYPMASLTYLEIPSNRSFDPDEMKQMIGIGFDVQEWRTFADQKAGVYIWQGHWQVASRIVRFAVAPSQNDNEMTRIVFSLYRVGYREPLALESFLMEAVLLDYQKRLSQLSASSSKQLMQLLWEFIIPTAHANDFLGLGQFTNVMSELAGAISGTRDDVADLRSDVRGATDQVTQESEAWRGSADRGLDESQSWRGTAGRGLDESELWRESLESALERGDQHIDSAMGQMAQANRNWARSNAEMARAIDVAERLSDPAHMFLLAGASAAGATLGAAVGGVATQGLTEGIDWLIEKITGRQAALSRWQDFREARAMWEETLGHALKLERAIDEFLLFHEVINTLRDNLPEEERANLSTEGILRFFRIEKRMRQQDIARLERLLEDTENRQCQREIVEEIVSIQDIIEEMDVVIAELTGVQSEISLFDDRYFCSQVEEMLRHLLDAESSLQRLRLDLINGQAEWRDSIAGELRDMHGISSRLAGDDPLRRDLRAARQVYEANKDPLIERFRRQCRREVRNDPNIGGLIIAPHVTRCATRHAEALPEYQTIRQQYDRALERAHQSAERRLERPIDPNISIAYQRLESYDSWFEMLEDQQFCSNNPTDERCQQIAQIGFNGAFQVKDRAFERLEEFCPNPNPLLIRSYQQR